MKKIAIFVGLTGALMVGKVNAHGNIICVGKSGVLGQVFSVEISQNSVIVRGGSLNAPHIFNNLTVVNGLITAPGLAVTFRNNYGCIREATIITELRQPFGAGYMETNYVATCSGGSTSDNICKPSR